MSDNQSPDSGYTDFTFAPGTPTSPGIAELLAVYHLSDDESAEREAFSAGMIHVDDLLDWEDYSDPDASYISYLETRELYERDGLI